MSEKTEQPTAKRLRDAREKGQIARSQEIPSAAVVLALIAYMAIRAPDIFRQISDVTLLAFSVVGDSWEVGLSRLVPALLYTALNILAPLVVLVIIASLASNLAQIGFLFSMKAAMPKLENLSPKKWFKKVFSKKGLFELLKNLIKITVLGLVVWRVLIIHWRDLFKIHVSDAHQIWSILGGTMWDLSIYAIVTFAILAVLDYFWERYQHIKQNMMSKDEVKREYKEMEGDPHIKGKRKQLHQEMISQGTMDKVRKAKVLVTNPTHYAVALDYEEGKTPMPIILAKGEGLLAQRMIAVAKQEGIPIMQQAPLARALYQDGTENSYIPKDLLGPVAEVLRWLKTLQR
ncbi:EscU/YscU/HrcU family type III secretion system export apparatus switch protein [Betaproteobacteria bacterium]|nr:EscU/YscU/HrcU family type III secretion system export apparatus switch protein [Betaproteobacteria bacterium]GHT92676.1 EscU/YscU/HrcU family type III secretion system export apparatus switch protein [Betaproteobacteria bacterium]GHU00187.1 EscU/YscU/HrcU family type III secretion system export apparatus switch protein [Betaproteobacteria bacterium]GHU07925.1 EscU/YscU/HrcU family type III secretion system export apparatus switch protein [Betaproteobacteria bacterium]GHU21901.1 EscU/YscU/Hr